MFGFIIFLLFLGLILVLFFLSVVFSVIRSVLSIFGIGRRTRRSNSEVYQDAESSQETARKQKVFTEDDGEYVDFEEIK